MEEQIKRIVKSQKVQYISFWIIPLLLCYWEKPACCL